MSLFKTLIPLAVAEFLKALPPGSTIEDFRADVATQNAASIKTLNTDPENVFVVWSNEAWESGLTVPVDYPLALLARGKGPKTAERRADWKARIKAQNEKQAAPAAPEPVPVKQPHYLTADELDAALKAGTLVEWQGIQPVWRTFKPGVDRWQPGYYYRAVDK